jgi:hypothetical protein
MPGGATLVATMKAHGAYAALVSGGFVSFSSVIAERLGFDENRANTLISADGVLTGDVARPILGRDAKVEALEEITARLGLTAKDVHGHRRRGQRSGHAGACGHRCRDSRQTLRSGGGATPDQPWRPDVDPVSAGIREVTTS